MHNRLENPALAMRIAFGLMATLAGLDKFFNILADWGAYVSPVAAQLLPFSPGVLMGIVGIVEFVVGLAILTAWPVFGAYVASGWLLLVAGNLVLGGHLDIAVRDVVLAIAAFALARLSEVRETRRVHARGAETVGRRLPA
jgi:hypothetical protein